MGNTSRILVKMVLFEAGNTSRILVKMVTLDAEFILVFIDSKTSTNKHLLAEKSHFFPVVNNMSNFGKITRGGPLACVLDALISLLSRTILSKPLLFKKMSMVVV